MSIFSKQSSGSQANRPVPEIKQLQAEKNSSNIPLLDDTFFALGLSKQEAIVYNYFFLYGPVDAERAMKGVNFPKKISKSQLDNSIKKLFSEGYLTEKDGKYKTSPLTFLIEKTSVDPKLKDLNFELKEFVKKSIE